MNWIWVIIIVIVVWYVLKQYQKNSPEARIEKLEGLAYEEHYKALEHAKKDLKEYEDKQEKKDYLMGKEQNDEMIKMSKKQVEKITEIEEMFVRLKERMKHKPAKEQFEIFADFYSYNLALNRLERRFEQLNYDFGETAHEDYKSDTKDIRIEMQEIEKRFDDRLK